MAQDPSRAARTATYKAYQESARALAQSVNRVMDRDLLEVSVSPTVWETEQGAFVECVIWVPREQGDR